MKKRVLAGLCKCCGTETPGYTTMLCKNCEGGVTCECGVLLICGCGRVMPVREHIDGVHVPSQSRPAARAGMVLGVVLLTLLG